MQTKGLTDKSRLNKIELAILILAATVTITFVSTSSPLYPFNPWNDANCFFTIGRGIIHGLVPYRDLFDHKGPVIYFVYALAALISEKSFLGVWILECISASIFAVFSWKTVKLLTEPSAYDIALMPLFLGVIYTCKMFNFGGNAEELFFPLLTVALYFGLKAIVKGDGLPTNIEAFICGLITAVLFWVKYTFLGFIAGFCLYIICLAVKRKDFKRLWSLIWRFLVGFLSFSVLVITYFAATGSLSSLIEVYYYINFFSYTGETRTNIFTQIPVIKNIYFSLSALIVTGINYPSFFVFLLLTLISPFFVDKKVRKKTIILFSLTFVLATGFIFTRSLAMYYYAYFLSYCFCLSIIPIIKGFARIRKASKDNPRFISTLLAGVLVIFYGLSIFLCKNMYLIFKPKDFLAQYRMAETINETPDAKILTYSVMDEGFYTAAGLLPSSRFFGAGKNLETTYPEMLEQQDRLIEEGYFDYIVTEYYCDKEWDNYVLIQEEVDPYIDFTGEGVKIGFKLYKRA